MAATARENAASPRYSLLRLAVHRVLAVVTAELAQLELLRHGLLVLGRRVVPALALGALQRDDLSSGPCHGLLPVN